MSEHGAALQTFNQQLVKILEDFRQRREDLQNVIDAEEADKRVLEKDIKGLQDKLQVVNNKLKTTKNLRDNYDNAIKETESAFKKILDSSHALLNLVQHEASSLDTQIDRMRLDI